MWSFAPAARPRPASFADIPAVTAESEAMSKALRKRGFRFVGPDHDVRADAVRGHGRRPRDRMLARGQLCKEFLTPSARQNRSSVMSKFFDIMEVSSCAQPSIAGTAVRPW